jgi:hypothetical protein
VSGLGEFIRLARFGEWEDSVDHWFQLASINELRDLRELLAAVFGILAVPFSALPPKVIGNARRRSH